MNAENNENLLKVVFSPNFMRCLINNLSQEDRFLNRAAQKSLKVITQIVDERPSSMPLIISGLVDGNGVYNFDQVTKTKTIEKLLSQADGENAREAFRAMYLPVVKMER